MALIDDADVQVHLPVDKLKVEEVPDDLAKCKLDTERIIRGELAGVIDSLVLATWTTSELTPDIIRAIGGRFCAALIYRTRYSENSLDDPEYAQNKYNEAMAMLMRIVNGEMQIEGIIIGTDFSSDWFYPNNAAGEPKFAMDDRY